MSKPITTVGGKTFRISTLRRNANRYNDRILKAVNRAVWLWGNRHRLRAEARLNRKRK